MRILFVAPRFHTNQVPLVRALQERGHEVHFHVLHVQESEDHSQLTPRQVEPTAVSRFLNGKLNREQLPEVSSHWLFPGPVGYLREVARLKPDAVIVKHPTLPLSLLASIAARTQRARLVFYTQSPVHAAPSRTRDVGRRALMRLFRASWISPVRGDADRYDRLDPDMHYLPFIAEPQPPRVAAASPGGATRIFSVGKFYPRKNHLLLVEAVKRLSESHRLTLTIAGECRTVAQQEHHQEVVRGIERLGLGEIVDLRLNVPFRCMPDLYRSHDLFVLPSRNEPAGVSILEAMAHGLPVVCSTTNGTRWYVREGLNGLVFESDDADDLTDKLATLLADSEGLRNMGEASRRLVETEHAADVVCDRLLDLLTSDRSGGL